MRRAPMVFLAVLAATVLVALGYFVGRHAPTGWSPTERASPGAAAAAGGNGKQVLYWYDTMVPQQHFDHPGLSPMGMQMVPRYADDHAADDKGRVRIDPATLQNLGVRTATVARRVLGSAVQVPARSAGTCASPAPSARGSMRW